MSTLNERLVIRFEQLAFQEHDPWLHKIDLIDVLRERFPRIRECNRGLLLEDCREVQERQIVVVRYGERHVTQFQRQRASHHIGYLIREPMVCLEGIAPISLDIYDGLSIPKTRGDQSHHSAKVHLHIRCCTPSTTRPRAFSPS